jgi:hypothetical protein
MTDTFASTVAVTIPVLMLAGTVELRSWTDTVTKRTIEFQENFVLRSFDFAKLIAQSRKQAGWAKIRSFTGGIVNLMLSPRSKPRSSLWLPTIWLMAILLAGISEVLTLLYLAGVHNYSAAVPLSVIAIIALIALLIVTPAASTFVIAPQMAIKQAFEKAKSLDVDADMLEATLDALPALVDLELISAEKGKEMTSIIHSRLVKVSFAKRFDTDRQERWRPQAQTGMRSSPRRPPHWMTQRHIGWVGPSYRNSSQKL